MNVSLLSNLQEIKKVYIQLSKKFNLPYDIIKSIFKINRNNDRQIEEEIRIFYKNNILFNIMEYKHANILISTREVSNARFYFNPKARRDIFTKFNELKEDIFKHRFPDKRGIEWGIKVYATKQSPYNINNKLVSNHINTMILINIIGEKNYLVTYKDGNILEADNKSKIEYLNTCSYEVIIDDYSEYLAYKHQNMLDWVIVLKKLQDGSICGERLIIL